MGFDGSAARKQIDPIEEIAKIAQELTGVQLNERHSAMISSRLQRRLKELNLADLTAYLAHLKNHWETERDYLIGALTTHHTYFFREFSHFEFLSKKVLEQIIAKARSRADKKIRIWSAACSRGQEVYSLAMWMQSQLGSATDIKLDILGTDIDPESVAVAKNGVYPWREVKEIPMAFLGSNWSRGSGEIAEFAKAKASVRAVCRFATANLLDLKLPKLEQFDIIFCRNVFIYFRPDQIQTITKSLIQHLDGDGFLFLGISESLHGLNLPLKSVGPSIYVRPTHSTMFPTQKPTSSGVAPVVSISPAAQAGPDLNKVIRVMVVDDSPSVQALMKQIFTKDHGFEIVASAKHGLEAAALLKTTSPDAVTLDIHMPEQDGIGYLRANHTATHPPVIMVTSVSREDSSLASQALELGASDYVEKPALNNLKERADEMRMKVRCAVQNRRLSQQPTAPDMSMDRAFRALPQMDHPEKKMRIMALQGSDRKRAAGVLRAFQGSANRQPPCLIVLDAEIQGAELLKSQFEREFSRPCKNIEDLKSGKVGLGDLCLLFNSDDLADVLKKATANKGLSILVYGEISPKLTKALTPLKSPTTQFLLEDLGTRNAKHSLASLVTDHSPMTGFHYISDQYLCKCKIG